MNMTTNKTTKEYTSTLGEPKRTTFFLSKFMVRPELRTICSIEKDSKMLERKEIEKIDKIEEQFTGKVEFSNGDKEWYENGELHRGEDLPAIEDADGRKVWCKNGKRHREADLPAMEYADGSKVWFKYGELHRDGGLPAKEDARGTKAWFKNGKRYRDGDLPAIENSDGYKAWYKDGKRHRDSDLPTREYANGDKAWYKDGELHRDGDLPAVEYADGSKEWWKDGNRVEQPPKRAPFFSPRLKVRKVRLPAEPKQEEQESDFEEPCGACGSRYHSGPDASECSGCGQSYCGFRYCSQSPFP